MYIVDMTTHQKKILNFIFSFQKKRRRSPSLKDIAWHFEVSQNAVHKTVDALVNQGELDRDPDNGTILFPLIK